MVTVFHAASLSGALADLEGRFESTHPEYDLRLEPSGSQVAARKVSELSRPADLVLVADWRVIEKLLVPEHADWLIKFASNEIVLAYGEHSPHTDEIDKDNWPGILTQPGVRLGRADENTAPLGFQTLIAWKLCELHYGSQAVGTDLAGRLEKRCAPERITPDIAELVSLLEARVIDYAFVFRSIAEEHNLKVIRLPQACNLSSPELAGSYARVKVPVILKSGSAPTSIAGSPIIYGLTIPKDAPNRPGAIAASAFLLGSEGRKALKRAGFSLLPSAVCDTPMRLPKELRPMVRAP